MRTKLTSRLSLLFVSFALMLALPAMAFADVISNNLDPSVDATAETVNLTAGSGVNGNVSFFVAEKENDDGKSGCNLTGSSKLVAAVNNSDDSVATVSASSVEFTSCGDVKQLTVTPLKAGQTTITLTSKENTTGGSFNLAPATFNVVVAAAAETQKDTSLAVSSASGTYGGTTNLEAKLSSSSTGVSGKSVDFTLDGKSVGSATTNSSGVATLSNVSLSGINAGTHAGAVVANFAGDTGYKASLGSNDLTVNKAPLTVKADNKSKTYGDANPTFSASYSGFKNSDTSSVVSGSPTFATEATASSPVKTGGYAITPSAGNLAASNYSFIFENGTLTIDKANLTVNTDDKQKTYGDANPAFTGDIVGIKNSDDITATRSTEATASSPVKTGGYAITATLNDPNSKLSNYNITNTGGTLTVNKAELKVNADNQSKVYGAADPALTHQLSGFKNGENATSAGATGNANCSIDSTAGPNAGTYADAITCAPGTLTANNYSFAAGTKGTLTIDKKELTGSFTAADKAYDGTDVASVRGSLTGKVGQDDVTLAGNVGSFDNKNVGTGKTVTVSAGDLSGAAAGNYTLKAGPWTTTANITAKSISGSFTASNKVYDGTTAATIATRSLQGVIAPDDVNLSDGSASFADKNVGTAKTVTGTGFGLSGTDAGNYTLGSVFDAAASITAKELTGSFAAADKVYDGNDSATVTGRSLSGAIAGDEVSLDGGTAKFNNKNVRTDKPVTLTGASLVGADKGNYTLGSVSNAQATITARDLTVSATGINKVYDGNASATVSLSTDELSGDAVTASYTGASFADKNVGNGKAVSVNGISISGADAANYNLTNATASTAADITARGLAVTATAANKVYDGTTDATVSLSDDRVRGDVLSTSYASASFDNANAGAGKVVTVSGISVAGADSGNYTFNTSTTTSADIAKRAITVTADAQSKLFGDADPALTYQVSGGPLVSGDSFSGNLSRDPGEAPGQYSILQGSVSAGPNYAVTYVGAKLTIGAWTLKGFYAPVDMGIWNTVKAGSTVPMKFEVFKGATELKSVSDIKSAAHKQVSCAALNTTAADAVELTTTGSTSLRFDTTSDQFIFNWKTQSGWAVNSCYVVTVVTQDGTPLSAYFKMK